VVSEDVIIIGDKVDLLGHHDRLYRTMIEDISDRKYFLVGVPRFGGVPMPIHNNEMMYMVFYRESGRYILEVQAVRFEDRNGVRYIWLLQKTEPHKDQRREAFRVPTLMEVKVFEYVEGMEFDMPTSGSDAGLELLDDAVIRDISVSGVALVTKHDYELEEKYLLKLALKWPRDRITKFVTCATVRRIGAWRDSDKNMVGFSFFGQSKHQSELISRFVLDEQLRQLKQKRLVENE